MKVRNVIIIAGVLALAAAGYFGWRQWRQGQPGEVGAATTTALVTTRTAITTVESSGPVEPQQQATLALKSGGTVTAVNVQVGQGVTAGQVLVVVDPGTAAATLAQAQADRLSAQTALDDLLTPATALQIANAEKAIVDAQAGLDKAQDALEALTSIDLGYYQDQVDAAQAALVTAQQNAEKTNIGDLKAAVERATAELETKTNALNDAQTAQAQCPDCTTVFVNALGRRMKLSDVQDQYDAAVTAMRIAQLNYEQALTNSSDAVKTAEDNLADAQANLADAQARNQNPDALELAQRQAALTVAQATLADAQEKLADLQAGPEAKDVADAQRRVEIAQSKLDALEAQELTAPFAGEVLAVNVQVGDPASAGQAALMLANRSQLHVDVAVDESDVSTITVGDPVTLTVDALPNLTLTGSVGAIDTFGQTVQGLVRYTVRVDVAGSNPTLYLNMTANATIVTNVQAEALAVPLDAVQFDDAGEFVNRQRTDGAFERVDIVSGETEDDYVFVTGDLRAGDRVEVIAPVDTPAGPGGLFGGGGR
ncbi:MAG: HlyD family efflux transporter periplasmic adaptor subunit [Anaerolineales bacterium]|nr:HlyD family efflux transporter periplasmic adaptor subunit [Anaerolineales bacterium]